MTEKRAANSAFLDIMGQSASPQLRRLQPGGPHCSFGTYLKMMQQASLLKPACCTSRTWAWAG
jgi:hypothetical protein